MGERAPVFIIINSLDMLHIDQMTKSIVNVTDNMESKQTQVIYRHGENETSALPLTSFNPLMILAKYYMLMCSYRRRRHRSCDLIFQRGLDSFARAHARTHMPYERVTETHKRILIANALWIIYGFVIKYLPSEKRIVDAKCTHKWQTCITNSLTLLAAIETVSTLLSLLSPILICINM